MTEQEINMRQTTFSYTRFGIILGFIEYSPFYIVSTIIFFYGMNCDFHNSSFDGFPSLTTFMGAMIGFGAAMFQFGYPSILLWKLHKPSLQQLHRYKIERTAELNRKITKAKEYLTDDPVFLRELTDKYQNELQELKLLI